MSKRNSGHKRRRRSWKQKANRPSNDHTPTAEGDSVEAKGSTSSDREILHVMRLDQHGKTRQTKQHLHFNPVWAIRLFGTSSANPLYDDSKNKGCIARCHVGRSMAKKGGTVFVSYSFHDRKKASKKKRKTLKVQSGSNRRTSAMVERDMVSRKPLQGNAQRMHLV